MVTAKPQKACLNGDSQAMIQWAAVSVLALAAALAGFALGNQPLITGGVLALFFCLYGLLR